MLPRSECFVKCIGKVLVTKITWKIPQHTWNKQNFQTNNFMGIDKLIHSSSRKSEKYLLLVMNIIWLNRLSAYNFQSWSKSLELHRLRNTELQNILALRILWLGISWRKKLQKVCKQPTLSRWLKSSFTHATLIAKSRQTNQMNNLTISASSLQSVPHSWFTFAQPHLPT